MLAVVMLCLAAMYAMQGAPFLAFVQIIVYTGAVLMLFLFVMMLIGRQLGGLAGGDDQGAAAVRRPGRVGLAVLLIVGIGHAAIGSAPKPGALQQRRQPHRAGEADLHHVRVPV